MHRFLKIALVALLFFALMPSGLKATAYYFGGELSWKVIRQDSVEVKVTLYTDCIYYYYNAITPQVNISSCDSSFTLKSSSSASVTDITPKCPSACTKCNNYTCSSLIGVYAHTFVVKFKITGTKCKQFTFSFYDASQRSVTITSGPQSTPFYIEANMFKGSKGFESSPQFQYDPITYTNTNDCLKQFQTATPGATGDSLYYSFAKPMKDKTTAVSYSSGYSYQQPLKYSGYPNPYDTVSGGCGGFRIDSLTGLLSFTPTLNIVTPLAIKVEQFQTDHKGTVVKTGEIIRESTINVGSWSKSTAGHVPSTISDINLTQSQSIEICSRTTFKIVINSGGNQKDAEVTLLQALPGINFTVSSNSKGRTIIGEVKPNYQNVGKSAEFMVTVEDTLCPIKKYSVKIFKIKVVDSIPVIEFEKIRKGCGNYRFRITSGHDKNSSYQWLIDTFKVSTDTAFNYHFATNGNHDIKLIVNRKSGCSKSFGDTILVNSFIKVTAGASVQICEGKSGQLNAKGAKKYNWSPTTGLSSYSMPNPTATPLKTTTYYLTAYDSLGCVYHDSVKVIVSSTNFTLTKDTSICPRNLVRLTASGALGMTFEWAPDATLSANKGDQVMAVPKVTTTYTVTVTNSDGCKGQKQVTIKVINPIADAGDDQTICVGDSVQLHATGGRQYTWRPNAGITDLKVPNPWVSPLKDQYYKVTTIDTLGCQAVDSVLVIVGKLDNISVRGSALVCPGDTIMVEANGGSFYEWSPAEFVSDPHSNKPRVFPSENTWFKVRVYDARHICSKVDSVRVYLDPDCVWPGDVNKDNLVDHLDLLNIGVGLGQRGSGRNSADWKSYHPGNWNYVTGELVNYKHIDADGDGVILARDTVIVGKFFGRKHGALVTLIKNRPTDPLVYVHFPSDTVYAGDTINAALYVGSPNKKAEDLYGLGTMISYDNKWMVAGSFKFDTACAFPCGSASTLKLQRINGTTIQFSAIRTDKKDTSGYGPMALISFVLKDTLAASYSPKGEIIPFKVSRTMGTTIDGKLLPLFASNSQIVVMRKHRPLFSNIEHRADGLGDIKIYPNPAQNYCIIESSKAIDGKIEVINALGQRMLSDIMASTKQYKLNTELLKPGVYFITIQNKNGIIQSKLVIEK